MSLVRNICVEIGNHEVDKMNHAYASDEPKLPIQTINKSFDVGIQEYVTVNS